MSDLVRVIVRTPQGRIVFVTNEVVAELWLRRARRDDRIEVDVQRGRHA